MLHQDRFDMSILARLWAPGPAAPAIQANDPPDPAGERGPLIDRASSNPPFCFQFPLWSIGISQNQLYSPFGEVAAYPVLSCFGLLVPFSMLTMYFLDFQGRVGVKRRFPPPIMFGFCKDPFAAPVGGLSRSSFRVIAIVRLEHVCFSTRPDKQ